MACRLASEAGLTRATFIGRRFNYGAMYLVFVRAAYDLRASRYRPAGPAVGVEGIFGDAKFVEPETLGFSPGSCRFRPVWSDVLVSPRKRVDRPEAGRIHT